MSIWMNFFGASPQALPLPCDSSQLRRAPISMTTSESFSTVERAAPGALRMGVGQQALGHAHRQERNAAFFDKAADRVVGLRIGRAFAENDQRALGAFEHVERALDGVRRRNLRRRRVDDLHQRLSAGLGVHHLAEQLGRQIEIDAARTARDRGADGARQADADIRRMQHAERRLAQRLGDRELVHLLVVALLQVDDLALGRARNQDHREAIGRGVRQRGQAVEKAGRRHGEADAGLLGEEARDRGGIAGVLLVTEGEDADARGLRHAAEIRDRNAGHAVDRFDAVELERVDDEMKAVGQLPLFRRQLAGFSLTAASAMGLSLIFNPDNRRISRHARQGRARDRAPVSRRAPCRALRALR